MTKLIVIKTTTNEYENAKKLCTILIEAGYVACCHISKIESIYKWNGDICNNEEYEALFITKDILYKDVEDIILKNHTYEMPQIISHDINSGYNNYLSWAKNNII